MIIILSILPIYSYYSNPNKPQYREAAFYLQNNIKNGDVVIANVQSIKVPFSYYSDSLSRTYGVSDVDEARAAVDRHNSVWLALSLTKYSDTKGTIKNYFDENYKLSESKKFYNVELHHYSRIP